MFIHQLHTAAAASTPDHTAVICGNQQLPYRELADAVEAGARALLGLGVRPGDRVSLFMHNIPEIIVLYLACSRAGVIAVPVSCYSKAPEVIYALNHCSARFLLASQKLYPVIKDLRSSVLSLERIFITDIPAGEPQAWQTVVAKAPAVTDWPTLQPADPAIILYTSGSTSQPKGVTHTQQSLVACAMNRARGLQLTASDRYLNSGYLAHGAAFSTALLPMLFAGGTAIFPVQCTPEIFLTLLTRQRATCLAAGPSQLWDVLELPDFAPSACRDLRYASCGGDVVSERLHQRFHELLGFPLSESIGMTECSTYMTTPPGTAHKTGSMGKPLPGVDIRLIDNTGRAVVEGEPGEILVRAKTMMAGYWNDPENTARALRDDWLHTGDLARRDADGYYYFVGRCKNMIVRDTCNISPGEVEDAINRNPRVRRSGVIGIPDERHGAKVIAFVAVNGTPAPTAAELEQHLATLLMGPRLPDRWIVLDELPATPAGKLDRATLLAMLDPDGNLHRT